jgi:hypothetical protein
MNPREQWLTPIFRFLAQYGNRGWSDVKFADPSGRPGPEYLADGLIPWKSQFGAQSLRFLAGFAQVDEIITKDIG